MRELTRCKSLWRPNDFEGSMIRVKECRENLAKRRASGREPSAPVIAPAPVSGLSEEEYKRELTRCKSLWRPNDFKGSMIRVKECRENLAKRRASGRKPSAPVIAPSDFAMDCNAITEEDSCVGICEWNDGKCGYEAAPEPRRAISKEEALKRKEAAMKKRAQKAIVASQAAPAAPEPKKEQGLLGKAWNLVAGKPDKPEQAMFDNLDCGSYVTEDTCVGVCDWEDGVCRENAAKMTAALRRAERQGRSGVFQEGREAERVPVASDFKPVLEQQMFRGRSDTPLEEMMVWPKQPRQLSPEEIEELEEEIAATADEPYVEPTRTPQQEREHRLSSMLNVGMPPVDVYSLAQFDEAMQKCECSEASSQKTCYVDDKNEMCADYLKSVGFTPGRFYGWGGSHSDAYKARYPDDQQYVMQLSTGRGRPYRPCDQETEENCKW